MGKYMKKSKITGDVAVMEVSQPTTLGVRTRARTLALQRTQPSSPACGENDNCYLQLRSRRLEKPPPPLPPSSLKSQNQQQGRVRARESQSGARKQNSASRSCGGSGDCEEREQGRFGNKGGVLGVKCDGDVEGSFGDSCFDFEARDRSTRESTPCSLIKESDNVGTPGSTTRQTSIAATNRRLRNDRQRSVPTTNELDEFFNCAEQQQQNLYMEKYNFDFVNEVPLPGRFEWVQVTP